MTQVDSRPHLVNLRCFREYSVLTPLNQYFCISQLILAYLFRVRRFDIFYLRGIRFFREQSAITYSGTPYTPRLSALLHVSLMDFVFIPISGIFRLVISVISHPAINGFVRRRTPQGLMELGITLRKNSEYRTAFHFFKAWPVCRINT